MFVRQVKVKGLTQEKCNCSLPSSAGVNENGAIEVSFSVRADTFPGQPETLCHITLSADEARDLAQRLLAQAGLAQRYVVIE